MPDVDDLTQRIVLQPDAVSIPAWWPHRSRSTLLAAMTVSAAEIGFANTRVQDVVELARGSRRTFYTNFDNREQCLLAAHAAVVDDAILATEAPTPREAFSRLMGYLSAWPTHAQLLLVEILAAGPTGLARHEEAMGRLAERLAVCAPRGSRIRGARGDELAQARFGSLHRLVQQRVITGQYGSLPRLTSVLTELATGTQQV
jgi:AcrR family transcriptional regulator